MIRAAALRDQITVYLVTQTGEEDRYGNPVAEEDEGTTVRAMVMPVQATEQEINADTRISRYRVLVEPTTVLDGISRIEWKERDFKVLGEPLVYTGIKGVHHFEFEMREILG